MQPEGGKCKWFDRRKGFGLIVGDNGNEYFAHKTNIHMSKQYLADEAKVTFIPGWDHNSNRANAESIKVILDRPSQKRRVKNTTNFTPDYNPLPMRVRNCLHKKLSSDFVIGESDVLLAPNIFVNPHDTTYFDKLEKETKDQKVEFKSWHGDSHWIADDKSHDWKSNATTFNSIIAVLSDYFNMEVKATRLNWYKDNTEWKPYHHDAAAVKQDKASTQDFTVSVSFGATRDVAFENAETDTKLSFEIPDCCVYAFGKKVNIDWKHGIPPVKAGEWGDEGTSRISIIAWGKLRD